MTDGIDEDPDARLTLTLDTDGTQGEQFLLWPVGIAHTNVQMQLLRIRRVRPARGNPIRSPVESQRRWPGPEPIITHPSMSSLILIPSTWQ